MDETKEKIDTASVSEKENEETKNLDDKIIDLRDGITAYEGKMLTVILGAIVTLIFSLVMYYFRKDISDNLTYIVITFICAIDGVSGLEQIMGAVNYSATSCRVVHQSFKNIFLKEIISVAKA